MVADSKVWFRSAENIEADLDVEPEMSVLDWFGFAWNRHVPAPLMTEKGQHLNLGAGYREVPWATSVDREHGFDLEEGLPQWADESVVAIWAHGVFEHIQDPVKLLWECQRVLIPTGVINIVVPHGASFLYLEDIDHKHPFTEETWRNLFSNPYYDATGQREWELTVRTCFIMGVAWRNLALFTQLVKEA